MTDALGNANLKQQFTQSTLWLSLAASGTSLVSFVIFIVLSRLLDASDIGLMALGIIWMEIGKLLVNAAFSEAIMQRASWDQQFASSGFWLNLGLSLLLCLGSWFGVAPLAAKYFDARALEVFQALSPIFLLEGIKVIHEGKLKREFRFKTIALRTVWASLAGGLAGVVLALQGLGVWALVWQQLLTHLLVCAITLGSAHWLPSPRIFRHSLMELLNFSGPLLISQLINNLCAKIYEILLGLILGPAALGWYRVGGRALYILQDTIIKPFDHTLVAALARIAQKNSQGTAALRVMRLSALLIFPIFFGAAAIGQDFIRLVFGERWQASGLVMVILALGVPPLLVVNQINASLTASGQSKLVMHNAFITLLANCALGLLAIPFGIFWAAAGFALRAYGSLALCAIYFQREFAIGKRQLLHRLAPAFFASLLMFALVALTRQQLSHWLPELVALACSISAGAVYYALLLVFLFRSEARYLLTEAQQLMPLRLQPLLQKIQTWVPG